MKRIFVLCLCALLSVNFLTVSGKDDPFLTRNFPASNIKEVVSETSGGSISITGNASSQAVVEVFVKHNSWSDDKIKQTLEESYNLDIKVENGKLYVMAQRKDKTKNWSESGLNISFQISVPNQVSSQLQTSGGSIQLANLSGTQAFKTSGGSLFIENVSGDIAGKTSGGSISISGSKENISLTTSGGSITAKDCSGKIALKTSGGTLSLTNLNGEIDANTSGGSITAKSISGTLKTGTSGGSVNVSEMSGNIEAKTSGGSMNVEMKSVDQYVKLSTNGNLNLTLPGNKGYNLKAKANKVETSGMKDFRGNTETKSIEGTVGNGGPTIEVKSSQKANISFK